MRINSINNNTNFNARWSKELLKEIKPLRKNFNSTLKEIKKVYPSKEISRDHGWYVLDKKGQNIALVPNHFDHVRNKFFEPDAFDIKNILHELKQLKERRGIN